MQKMIDTNILQFLRVAQDRKNRVAIVELCLFVFMKGRKKYIILKEGGQRDRGDRRREK